jgi:hypothetical protein
VLIIPSAWGSQLVGDLYIHRCFPENTNRPTTIASWPCPSMDPVQHHCSWPCMAQIWPWQAHCDTNTASSLPPPQHSRTSTPATPTRATTLDSSPAQAEPLEHHCRREMLAWDSQICHTQDLSHHGLPAPAHHHGGAPTKHRGHRPDIRSLRASAVTLQPHLPASSGPKLKENEPPIPLIVGRHHHGRG